MRLALLTVLGVLLACDDAPSIGDAGVGRDTSPAADDASASAADAAPRDADGPPDAEAPRCSTPPHAPACDDTMCVVPAGCFRMGSPLDEPCREADEVPHEVTLTRDFLLSRTEVTRAQFRAAMGYETYGLLQDHPVTEVTWHEVAAYANALSDRDGFARCYVCSGVERAVSCAPAADFATIYDCPGYRHPTEAEWEHAYRAGTSGPFYSGTVTATCAEDPAADAVAWYIANANGALHSPGGRAPNAWGLHDMAGNALEWTFDRQHALTASAAVDPVHPITGADDDMVMRSGGWLLPAWFVRAAARLPQPASEPLFSLGARIARTLPAAAPRPVGVPDGGVPDGAVPEACSPNVLPMPIQVPDGPRIHVQLPFEGREQLLLVDSGSNLTNFYLPASAPRVSPGVGLVTIGCEPFPFYGRNVRAGQVVRGLPVLGALGTDWLLARPTALDLAEEQLLRWATADEIPGRAALVRLPYQLSREVMLVEARLDGVPVRLMLDTGTPRTLWIGPRGAPTDAEIRLQDENGRLLPVREGNGVVELAGEAPFTELIWRTPSAGSLETYLRQLAPDVVGILGLASLRTRRVYFGAEEGAVLLEPLP